jgi:hypothetical protein
MRGYVKNFVVSDSFLENFSTEYLTTMLVHGIYKKVNSRRTVGS